jgi:hypothetical protein
VTVPSQHGFRFHNEQRRAPTNEPPTYENPEATIRILEAWPWLAALQNQQLLPEAKIICDQQHLWSDSRSNRPQQTAKHSPLPLLSDGKRLRSMLSIRKALRITILRPSGNELALRDASGDQVGDGDGYSGCVVHQRYPLSMLAPQPRAGGGVLLPRRDVRLCRRSRETAAIDLGHAFELGLEVRPDAETYLRVAHVGLLNIVVDR